MIIPLYAQEARCGRVVYAIMAACAVCFVMAQLNPSLYFRWGLIPAEVVQGRDFASGDARDRSPSDVPGDLSAFYTPRRGPATPEPARPAAPMHAPAPGSVYTPFFLKTFVHANPSHLFFNLIALWVFGGAVERYWVGLFRRTAAGRTHPRLAGVFGRTGFLLFFFGAGALSTLGQIWSDPSATHLIVGASGAIAALMGMHLSALPGRQVFAMMGVHLVSPPTWTVVLFYSALQVIFALHAEADSSGPTVAYFSHLMGLGIGAASGLAISRLGGVLKSPDVLDPPNGKPSRTPLLSRAPKELALSHQVLLFSFIAALSCTSLLVAVENARVVGVPLLSIVPAWLYLTPTLLYPAQIATIRSFLGERSIRLPWSTVFPSFSARDGAVALALCVAWAFTVRLCLPHVPDALLWMMAPVFFLLLTFLSDQLIELRDAHSRDTRVPSRA